VRLLGGHGVLNHELAISIREAVGFRNVLVYDYIEIDDSIVVDRLKSLGVGERVALIVPRLSAWPSAEATFPGRRAAE